MTEAAPKTEKNQELILKDVRLSFAQHLFEPQEFKDDKDPTKVRYTYNVNALIPKKLADGTPNPQVKVLQEALKKALEAGWPGQGKMIPPERRCVRDGEPIDPDTVDPDVAGSGTRRPLYDGYEGCFFVSANRAVEAKDSPNPVQLLGPQKTAKKADGTPCFPRLTRSDGLLYSGCYADVIIRIYPYDGKGKNPDRLNASLEAVKFKRHGTAFGAKPVDADSMFDEEPADDGFDSPGAAPKTAAPADDLM